MTMDWKQLFKFHNRSFRDPCIVFLLIAINLFILIGLSKSWRPVPEAVSAAVCGGNQRGIYRIMRDFSGMDGFELPPEWTVADLIREAAGKDFQTHHPRPGESVAEMGRSLEKKEYLCRNIHYERKFPYLRRERTEVIQPYLVFPVSASVVFDKSLQEPVPILMCPPGAHCKYGSMVLYSDGSTKKMTAEEAEKSPQKSVLLQCVGASERVVPQFVRGKISGITSILMCSDGFWRRLSEGEIREKLVLSRVLPEEEMKKELDNMVEHLKELGETDNISAIHIAIE